MNVAKKNDLTTCILSFSERRLWFMEQLTPNNAFYNILVPIEFTEAVDISVIERAFNELIQRHDIFRSSYHPSGCEGVRCIHEEVLVKIKQVQAESLNNTNEERLLMKYGKMVASIPFSLEEPPLLRPVLVRFSEQRSVLYVVMHHIITDKWTINILLREFDELYTKLLNKQHVTLPPLELTYRDFALWQRDWLEKDEANEQLNYWLNYLKGAKARVPFPTDFSRPKVMLHSGDRQLFEIDKEDVVYLLGFLQENNVTPAILFLSLWMSLIFRYISAGDFTVGSTMGARFLPGTEEVPGCFINILIMRAKLNKNTTFSELVKEVRNDSLNAYANSVLPYEFIVEKLNPQRETNILPYSQLYYQFTDLSLRKNQKKTIMFYKVNSGKARFDLMLNMWESKDRFAGAIEYSTEIFTNETIVRLIDHLKLLLKNAIRNPSLPITKLPMLTLSELDDGLQRLVTSSYYNRTKPAISLIEQQALPAPNATAVEDGADKLTYKQLISRANNFAHILLESGLKKNQIVAVCMSRTVDLPVVLLAIQKAGGAFLSLNEAYLPNALSSVISDSDSSYIVVDEEMSIKFKGMKSDAIILNLDQYNLSEGTANNYNQAGDYAYAIATSGSGGKSKIVLISQESVIAFLTWGISTYSKKELLRTLASSHHCFDISIFEMFLPLCAGGTVIIVENLLDYNQWKDRGITLINTVPSVVANLLKAIKTLPKSVVTVNLAGEVLTRELANDVYNNSGISKLYNLYGPSECTIYAVYKLVERDSTGNVSIGTPIPNMQAYVLNQQLLLQPVGVAGELYLGGDGVSLGYLREKRLEKEHFVLNPFSAKPNDYLYKTGDICRYALNGEIEFIGREDKQVKLNGFRVNLEEVEKVIASFQGVSSVVVVKKKIADADKLVAYYVSDLQDGYMLTDNILHKHAKKILPVYLCPNEYVQLDHMPRLASDKIDRQTLTNIVHDNKPCHSELCVPPSGEIEKVIYKIWSDKLKVKVISVHDDFFQLGGHSFLAVFVIRAVADKFGLKLPLRMLYEMPTIAMLAQGIQEKLVYKEHKQEMVIV